MDTNVGIEDKLKQNDHSLNKNQDSGKSTTRDIVDNMSNNDSQNDMPRQAISSPILLQLWQSIIAYTSKYKSIVENIFSFKLTWIYLAVLIAAFRLRNFLKRFF